MSDEAVIVDTIMLQGQTLLHAIASWAMDRGLRIAAVVAISLLLWTFVRRWLRRGVERVNLRIEQRQRALTLANALEAVASVAIAVAAGLSVLSILNVPIAPFLASAGLLGLAVSVGSQALVRDFIAGLFVLAEDQYGIGDHIRAAGVSGRVERITMRATWLCDESGEVHIIPNSAISVMTNYTKKGARARVRLSLSTRNDLESIQEALEAIADRMWLDEGLRQMLAGRPAVAGPVEMSSSAVVFELWAPADHPSLYEAQRRMRLIALTVLRERDIALA